MTDRDRFLTAIHEAAHVVVGELLGRRARVVSIEPRAKYRGKVIWEKSRATPDDSNCGHPGFPIIGMSAAWRRNLEASAVAILAGPLAALAVSLRFDDARQAGYRPQPEADVMEILAMLAPTPGDRRAFAEMAATANDDVAGDAEQARRKAFLLAPLGQLDYASAELIRLEAKARAILADPGVWAQIEAVAAALVEAGELSGRQVRSVIAAASGADA